MKAAVYHRYGPAEVVHIEDLPKPAAVANEVLIKIRATTVSSADARVRSLNLPKGFGLLGRPVFGVFGPRKKILGTEFAGEIIEVGSSVTKFKPGDSVFGFPGIGMGCHAEYRLMPESGRLLTIPAGISFGEAAAISFAGTTALYFLRDLAKLQRGERLLIIGGSGAVGSSAIQIAKHLGGEVSAVTSTSNIECVRRLGANHVIDYTAGDFRQSEIKYDVVFDTIGTGAYRDFAPLLEDHGRLLLGSASLPQMLMSICGSISSRQKVLLGSAPERLEDLIFLKKLVEAGCYKPLIDQEFPLSEICAAHARVDSGRKKGSVVVTL